MQKTLQDVEELSRASDRIEEQYTNINNQTPSLIARIDKLLDNVQPQLDLIDELEWEHANLERISTVKDLRLNIKIIL